MTEEQQLEWALRMSMQEGIGAASCGAPQTPSQNTTSRGQEISAMGTAATPKNKSGTSDQMEIDDSDAKRDASPVVFFERFFSETPYHYAVMHVIFYIWN